MMLNSLLRNRNQKILAAILALFFLIGAVQLSPFGIGVRNDSNINKDWRSIAIEGYDPVAYFTEGKPTKGNAKIEHDWNEATWRFSQSKHRDLFVANPEKYAPRFGGFCAGAMSIDRKAPVDPEAWVIVDGKLYLTYNKQGRDEMAEDPLPIISEAETNWEQMLEGYKTVKQ